MKVFVVDTHTLVWFLSNDKRLSSKVGEILESPEVFLLIPTIVLAEITHLHRKGRITQPLEKVWQFLQKDSRCIIYPIDVVLKMPLMK
jgi:PIN domain nuclease of toxin-antitoxin system